MNLSDLDDLLTRVREEERLRCVAEHEAINKLTRDLEHLLGRIYEAAREGAYPNETRPQFAQRIMRMTARR